MGFCYPGTDAKGGDKPPRPKWHPPLLAGLPNVELTILIEQYAQKRYLEGRRKKSLTETVRHWREYTPDFLPFPHPSWRNNVWVKKNPWFAEEVLKNAAGAGCRIIRLTPLLPTRPYPRLRSRNGGRFRG